MTYDRGPLEPKTPSLLRELAFIVFDRLKLITAIFIGVFFLFFLYAILTPNTYQSSANFTLTIPRNLNPLQMEATWDFQGRSQRVLQAQQELIYSNRVLEHVITQFYPDTTSDDYVEVLTMIRKNLSVTPPEGQTFAESSTFHVTYSDNNPQRAYEIASFIANIYMMEYEKLAREKTDYSYVFFRDQTAELYKEMIAKADALREYETEQALALIEILNLTSDNQVTVEVGPNALLNQFQGKYYALTEDLTAINNAINTLENEMREHKVPALPHDMEVFGRAVVSYRNKVAQLEILMNEMKTQFTESFTPFQQAKKEFELGVRSLREELTRTIRAQRMNAEMIAARIQEVEKVILELQERIRDTAYERSEYVRIKQEYDTAREAYLSAKNQTEQARLASAVNQSQQYLTLIEKPMLPTTPSAPNRMLIVLFGVIAGTFFSLGIAITMDYFDHTLKKPEDIEHYFNVPNLGSLPRVS